MQAKQAIKPSNPLPVDIVLMVLLLAYRCDRQHSIVSKRSEPNRQSAFRFGISLRMCLCRESVLINHHLPRAIALDLNRPHLASDDIFPSGELSCGGACLLISRGPGLARDLQDQMLSNFCREETK